MYPANYLSIAEGAMEEAINDMQQRNAFDKSIGKFHGMRCGMSGDTSGTLRNPANGMPNLGYL